MHCFGWEMYYSCSLIYQEFLIMPSKAKLTKISFSVQILALARIEWILLLFLLIICHYCFISFILFVIFFKFVNVDNPFQILIFRFYRNCGLSTQMPFELLWQQWLTSWSESTPYLDPITNSEAKESILSVQ